MSRMRFRSAFEVRRPARSEIRVTAKVDIVPEERIIKNLDRYLAGKSTREGENVHPWIMLLGGMTGFLQLLDLFLCEWC
jgi:hypothetical protein